MLVTIFQILYLLVFLAMSLMSLFIVYHIVFYSYTTASKIFMLALFVPVVLLLLFSNMVIFQSIPLADIFSNLVQ